MQNNAMVICTVGGTPGSIISSCVHYKASKVIFIPSKGSKKQIPEIVEGIQAEMPHFGPANYEIGVVIEDHENIQTCVEQIRSLASIVRKWVSRGDDYTVYVDFTGGTKAMAAGLALAAQRWPCRYAYVGGEKRDKDGIGIVVKDHERISDGINPFIVFGYQAQEDALLLFNEGNYSAAEHILNEALHNSVASEHHKAQIVILQKMARAYGAWDRFLHREARNELQYVQKRMNDMLDIVTNESWRELQIALENHIERLKQLEEKTLGKEIIEDILANAQRRAARKQFDDAVARLYRALEAFAQLELLNEYDISTSSVAVHDLPAPLRQQWAVEGKSEIQLGMRKAYALLAHWGNDLGKAFEAKVSEESQIEDTLSTRNESILAHGLRSITKREYERFWNFITSLVHINEEQLVHFPRLIAAQS